MGGRSGCPLMKGQWLVINKDEKEMELTGIGENAADFVLEYAVLFPPLM